jgi:hypothetical protein
MTVDEKDRLGEKLRDVQRAREHQYFAERDRELLERLRGSQDAETEVTPKEAAHMCCPKCGTHLQRRTLHEIVAEECLSCHGVWLDERELQKVAHRESEGWIARWLRTEFRKPE